LPHCFIFFRLISRSTNEKGVIMTHKMAIIGYGGMAGYHHRHIKENFPELEIAGIYDIREDAINKAHENGLIHFTSPERPESTTKELELPEVSGSLDVNRDRQTDWLNYYKNIIETLEGKAQPIVKVEEALRVMKVIDLVFESDAKKCGIPCNL
jgi:predicted dehydrogenase